MEHLLWAPPALRTFIAQWALTMQSEGLPVRCILEAPQLWPQRFEQQETPFPLGVYGQSSPPTLEDQMFLFDRLCRMNPLSIQCFLFHTAPSTAQTLAFEHEDLFFHRYLSRYLEVPCYFFEIFLKKIPKAAHSKQRSFLQISPPEESENFKHFGIYLPKNSAPHQEQVKLWIREAYPLENKFLKKK